ncbi:MAG: type II secretion system protein M [Desulfobacterales bacterium]|nr:type II secretion system protein M [Desulfobacterales bacterium]
MGNLSYREKMTVAGGGVLVLLFILVQFIYLPAWDRRADLEQALAAEKNALNRLRVLREEYRSLAPDHSGARDMILNRGKGFTLFSFLDRKAAKSGVKGNIDYMKPHTREQDNSPFTLSIVKLKLKQIVLRDFTRFIREVESPGSGIWIASLSMNKSGKEKNLLEATIEAHTLVAKEGK